METLWLYLVTNNAALCVHYVLNIDSQCDKVKCEPTGGFQYKLCTSCFAYYLNLCPLGSNREIIGESVFYGFLIKNQGQ